MKTPTTLLCLIFVLLSIQFISAEILLSQPNELYNLGDVVSVPATIKTTGDIQGFFQMYLICNGQEKEFYKEYVFLSAGEEKRTNPSFLLVKNLIGNLLGTCKIKATLGEEYALSNEFSVLNSIDIKLNMKQTEFFPKQDIILEGEAIKTNGQVINGFVELNVPSQNKTFLETVNKGYFLINFSFPKETKAEQHLLNLKVYEKDKEGNITNQGFIDYNILIKQVPTFLEISFGTQEVEPGTNLKVSGILHDQTGEPIESIVIITVKNQNNKIIEQTEKPTGEFLELPIQYNTPPANWTIFAVSNKLTSESTFTIREKQDIKSKLINGTLIITNTGNVPYNKNILVKIGDKSEDILVSLKVDESKKYKLSAPDGEYKIEIVSDGQSKISENVVLTGKTIEIKEDSNVFKIIRYPFVWIFIIAIFGFVAFMVVKKGYKKSFFGHIGLKKRSSKKDSDEKELDKALSLDKIENKAELSLSLKGDKQDISIICLKLKNAKEIGAGRGNAKETIKKIIKLSEERKTVLYENAGYLFFIFAPVITKTFRNEKTAVNTAQEINLILAEHNKKFQEKIEFGISLNHGTMIAKKEKNTLKFMSLGNLISASKKIASLSNQEILLGKSINEKLISGVKTEKHTKEGVEVYALKEIREKEGDKTFLKSFMKRMDGEKKSD